MWLLLKKVKLKNKSLARLLPMRKIGNLGLGKVTTIIIPNFLYTCKEPDKICRAHNS